MKPPKLRALPPKPPRESAEAHAAKLEYAQLGPGRTLEKLVATRVQSASKASLRLASFKRWSAQFGWQEFVKQWDAEQALKKQQVALEAQEKLNEQQAKIAQDASMRVWKRLNDLLAIDEQVVQQLKQADQETLLTEERPPLLVTPSNLISYFRITADLARVAVGAANTITQQQHTGKGGGLLTIELVQRLASETEDALEQWRQERGLPALDAEDLLHG